MLAVALPEIRDGFHVGHAAIAWLVSAYLIAMAIAQPLGGRVGDQLGRGRVFRLGLVAFLALSVAAALAPSFPVLVVLRTGQALVGAMVIPNGTAMLRANVPERQLGVAMGIMGSILSFSAGVGPMIGSALLSAGSWRLLFVMNVPLVGAALLCAALLRYDDGRARSRLQVDVPGTGFFATLLVSVTFVLSALNGGAATWALAAALAVVVLSGGLFARRQARSASPVAEWSLFRNRSFAAATVYILLTNLVMYTTLLAIPFFLKEVQGKSAGTAGLLLGALSILTALMAPLAGRLSDVRGRRLPSMVGAVCQVAGALLMAVGITRDVSAVYLAVCLAVLGFGVGLGTGPASTAAVEAAPKRLAGAAAGTNSMMRYVGSIIGSGVLGSVLNAEATTPGVMVFRVLFAFLVVISAMAVVASGMVHDFAAEPEPVGAARPARASAG